MTARMTHRYTASMIEPARIGLVPGHGLRLSYREWSDERGDTLPLVLLHGLTGRSEDWAPIAGRLSGRRRVLALDARGHGSSEWARSADYTADAHFADVVTALEELGVARCALVGYSMGGSIAILIAGALPELVARLVVVDSYPAPEMTTGSLRIARWLAASYASRERGDRWAGAVRPRFDPAIARRLAEELAEGEARRADLWPLWEEVCCPVLLVRGAQSTVLPEPLTEEMLARQPGARLATIEGVGHGILYTRPLELAALIEQFLEEGAVPSRTEGEP